MKNQDIQMDFQLSSYELKEPNTIFYCPNFMHDSYLTIHFCCFFSFSPARAKRFFKKELATVGN